MKIFSRGGAAVAAQVAYDNTASGLAAVDVQDAIDELAMTSAGYAGIFPQATPPTTAEISTNRWGFWDDTATGKTYTVRNRSGTLYAVEITPL